MPSITVTICAQHICLKYDRLDLMLQIDSVFSVGIYFFQKSFVAARAPFTKMD